MLTCLVLFFASELESAPKSCIDHYRVRQQSLENAVVKSDWEDSARGKPSRRDRQFLVTDSIGRWRLKMVSEEPSPDGSWVRHKDTPHDWDVLFDGQITANMTHDPTVDRSGVKGSSADDKGYRSAQIHDGDWDALKNQRTPLTFTDPFVNYLDQAIQNKQDIEITKKTDEILSFKYPAKSEHQFWRLDVDKSRDWIPIEMALEDQDGQPMICTKIEYGESAGLFYVKSGHHQFFGNKKGKTPLRETRFEVTECKLNDPDFSEDHFKIELTEDTAVQDLRYDGVVFRIGQEKVVAEQLAALAQEALKKKQLEEEPGGAAPTSRRLGVWFVAFNAVLILALVVMMWVQRKRQSATAE